MLSDITLGSGDYTFLSPGKSTGPTVQRQLGSLPQNVALERIKMFNSEDERLKAFLQECA